MRKLSGLTIFFPFYNDAGTVLRAVDDAYFFGKQVAASLEVIAIHGGVSRDSTWTMMKKAKRIHKSLKLLDKSDNVDGYAVIKYGFQHASKPWVFYTDGDLQYSMADLPRLVAAQQKQKSDVVNGYLEYRCDPWYRIVFGSFYKLISRNLFQLPIRDTDCDFRLIKKLVIDRITLQAHDSSILPEMIKKLELVGATFSEIPVKHFPRSYGKSNYSVFALTKEKFIGDLKMWWSMYAE